MSEEAWTESQKVAVSLVKGFLGLSRIRPCLVIWDWCVTDVRRQGGGKLKRKIPRRNRVGNVGTEMVLLHPSNSPQEKVSNNFFPEEWKALSLYSS